METPEGTLFEKIWHRFGKQLRFLIVGGVNTLVGLATYPLLLVSFPLLHQHYLFALLIAQIVNIAFAYVMYKRNVFKTKANFFREFSQFASFYVIVFALNWATLPALVELGGLSPIWAQLGFSLLTVAASYGWHSKLTFRPRTKDE